MGASPLRRRKVDVSELADAMQRSNSDMMEDQRGFLDLETGEIVWAYDSDEDFGDVTNADPQENAALRERTEKEPDRFIVLPSADPIDDNELLREFLRSDWTNDQSLRRVAEDAYRGSVGRWRRSISHDTRILHAWRDFEARAWEQQAIEFLAEQGVEPEG